MAKDDDKRPIIIKKIKKGGHAHHGGAWKVAYADFVTAMMAFFLLLWLLSSSSKATLDSISEYFTPTVGVKDQMGIGFKGGSTVSVVDGIRQNDSAPPNLVTGATPTGVVPDEPKPSVDDAQAEAALFEQAQSNVKEALRDTAQLAENVFTVMTPDGLRIDIVDSDKHPMFVPGTSNLTPEGQAILARMLPVIKKMPNYLSITGHTDASPLDNKNPNYTNWELSADRANSARRYLLSEGMELERAKQVLGMADREPLDEEDPRNPKNRRIAILMLKGSHLALPGNFFPNEAQ
ncbi:MAG: flagellar motor protein MotB [Rickettsiales bacterium]